MFSVLLVLAAIAWIPLNKAVEGPILVALSPHHGITAADLLSVAAVLVALCVWPWGAGRR